MIVIQFLLVKSQLYAQSYINHVDTTFSVCFIPKFSIAKQITEQFKPFVTQFVTMGSAKKKTEPKSIVEFYNDASSVEIFRWTWWIPFVEKLKGFDVKLVANFMQTFQGDSVTLRGYTIPISPEVISMVSGFTMRGINLYSHHHYWELL